MKLKYIHKYLYVEVVLFKITQTENYKNYCHWKQSIYSHNGTLFNKNEVNNETFNNMNLIAFNEVLKATCHKAGFLIQ